MNRSHYELEFGKEFLFEIEIPFRHYVDFYPLQNSNAFELRVNSVDLLPLCATAILIHTVRIYYCFAMVTDPDVVVSRIPRSQRHGLDRPATIAMIRVYMDRSEKILHRHEVRQSPRLCTFNLVQPFAQLRFDICEPKCLEDL